MDRPRRIWFGLTIPVVSVIAFLLIGSAWLEAWFGAGHETSEPSPALALRSPLAASDRGLPRLLPEEAVLASAGRLRPSSVIAQDCGSPASWDDDVLLAPLDPSVDPAEAPDASSTPGPAHEPGDESAAPTAVAEPELDGPSKPSIAVSSAADVSPMPGNLSEPTPSTPWATPYRPGERSAQLERTAAQADEHTRRGFDLASRKAYHSARAEFIRALRVVAQGLDAEHGSRVHGDALAAGLKALDEAEDFVPIGSGLEGSLDLGEIVGGHDTPVLKLVDCQRLTPLEAVGRYVDFAREQLAVAAGGEVAGSMALHALGKLQWSLADRQVASRPIDDTKALAYFQAAVEVCPENYLTLNDLGVLLARGGRFVEARRALERSFAASQDPTVLANLAGLYQRLGDTAQARQAQQVAAQLAAQLAAARGRSGQDPARPAPPVAWKSPQEFANSYAGVAGPWQPPAAQPQRQPTAAPVPDQAPVKEASRGWPWDHMFGTRK
ncbi:MAG: hypothetical protein JW719_01190 [Pirellulales bacterium]|nr:hypothetical protein [Pirellulales bacterium]